MTTKIQFQTMKGTFQGETIIACGTGPSIESFDRHDDFLTVGSNAVPKYFKPTWLTFIDSPKAIPEDRWKWIKHYKGHVFHQEKRRAIPEVLAEQDIWWEYLTLHPIRRIHKDARIFGDFLYSSYHSGFAAMAIACWLGATKVGLIGMDMTEGHPLHRRIDIHNRELGWFRDVAEAHGIQIFNLSRESNLTAVPFAKLKEF